MVVARTIKKGHYEEHFIKETIRVRKEKKIDLGAVRKEK